MGNLILKKIIASLLCASALTVGCVFLLPLIGLMLPTGEVLTSDGLWQLEGVQKFALLVFVFSLIAVLLTLLLTPLRRRRSRPSGTVVESDVEDGRERGTVKWFNMKKGFGFITWERGNDREDVFVHFRSIRGQGYRTLGEGQKVKFTIVNGEKGPQAEDVSAVK